MIFLKKYLNQNDDYHDEVIVYYNVMLEYRSLIISNIKSSAWENELAKDIVVKGTIQPDLHEVAMRCLWNLTMYGSSPIKETIQLIKCSTLTIRHCIMKKLSINR